MIIISSQPERFSGELYVPGDKSITHRALMIGALARGITEVREFPDDQDCRAAVNCLRSLGVRITFKDGRLLIEGRNKKLRQPLNNLDAGNSGTTARLLLGVLAGQGFKATLSGELSLQKCSLKDVTHPLQLMGAVFEGNDEGLPLTTGGARLQPISYRSPRASAQVKSAILLAGLYPRGTTTVEEPEQSPNHTELMLDRFGAKIMAEDCRVTMQGGTVLKGGQIRIPGDISAAAFLMVAAALVPGSDVLLKNVGVNPTRSGIIDVLIRMGADIEVQQEKLWGKEPIADIQIRAGSKLKGLPVGGDIISRLEDEIPALAVAASVAEGRTVISNGFKRNSRTSERLVNLAGQLNRLGAKMVETEEGMIIEGGTKLKGTEVDCCGDHLLARALVVAGLAAEGDTVVHGAEVINTSFPGFMQALRSLIMK